MTNAKFQVIEHLKAIASLGGNMPDESFMTDGGPRDSVMRGGLFVSDMEIARLAIAAIEVENTVSGDRIGQDAAEARQRIVVGKGFRREDLEAVLAHYDRLVSSCVSSPQNSHISGDRTYSQAEVDTMFKEWQSGQHYRYIGKDGKTVLARDLEDRAEKAEAEVKRLREESARLTKGIEFWTSCHDKRWIEQTARAEKAEADLSALRANQNYAEPVSSAPTGDLISREAAKPVAWLCEDLIFEGERQVLMKEDHAKARAARTEEWRITPLYAIPAAHATQKGEGVKVKPCLGGTSDDPVSLTYQQKLDALSLRFYQGMSWTPKAGDYYTTSRADLELYQVVAVEAGKVHTRYCDPSRSTVVSEWEESEFTSAGFGPRRVYVPDFVLAIHLPTTAQKGEA